MNREDREFKRELRHSKSHPLLHWAIIIAFVLGCFYLYEGLSGEHIFQQHAYDNQNQSTVADSRLNHKQPVNVLMMGTDTGAVGRYEKRGRTDTMIIDTINPQEKSMLLTSIPRDSPSNYNGMTTKINSIYLFSGGNNTEKYVQNWLGVPINYYVLINMGGLNNIINSIGGVTVTPPITFKYGATNVKKGQTVTLNGMQALDYCRMRHQDPLGDYGRQIRQRQVLFQVFDAISKPSMMLRHPSLAKSVSQNIQTNLSTSDLMKLFALYRHASQHHISSHLQGQSTMINGQSFEQISASEKAKHQQQIMKDYND